MLVTVKKREDNQYTVLQAHASPMQANRPFTASAVIFT
jgi:hypothetical protein